MNPNYPYNQNFQPYFNGYSMPAQNQQFVPQQAMQTAQPMQSVQQTPTQATNGLNGRIVNDVSQILPNEVLMNGSYSIFPTSDFSAIYAKTWNADGTIKTLKFTPEVQTTQEETKDTAFNDSLVERLDRIEKLLKTNTTKKGETK